VSRSSAAPPVRSLAAPPRGRRAGSRRETRSTRTSDGSTARRSQGCSSSISGLPATAGLDTRAGVPFNRTHYFIDEGQQRGIAYESLTSFDDELNRRLDTGLLTVRVAFVPLPRMMIPALQGHTHSVDCELP